MARPSKYKPEYAEQAKKLCELGVSREILDKAKPLPLCEAWSMPVKCVYILFGDGGPAYVGRTKNFKDRAYYYRKQVSHNKELNEWLKESRDTVTAWIIEAEDIENLEIELISILIPHTFNISDGTEQYNVSRARTSKPWIAKPGVLSPISAALRIIKNQEVKKEIRAWLKTLNDAERCAAELETFQLAPSRNKKWLEMTGEKMAACLEEYNRSFS